MKNTKLFIQLSYALRGRKELLYYADFIKNQKFSITELEQQQFSAFLKLFNYCKENIPYYRTLFKQLNLNVKDFNSLKDLEKIPILTKKIILENYAAFLPDGATEKYANGSTGGSTGDPLKYRMSIEDYSKGTAILYRGFGYAGYNIGDKMAVIAGGSLVKNETSIVSKVNKNILNFKSFSSFGMDENDLESFYFSIKKWNPPFLRGYASSLAFFANYCLKTNKKLYFKAVFSTAEMLSAQQRQVIEKAFNTNVFNNYGLNDGGISAYEDKNHDGFIIDTERGILEIVPENTNSNTMNKKGRIIATSLFNYSFPFIRYDTGDIGTQIKQGEKRKKLIDLGGRITDFIVLKGKTIGSPVLTILMGKVDAVKYQVIQKKNGSLEIRILKGLHFQQEQEDYIKKSLTSNIGKDIDIQFIYTDKFIASKNKHKFIIKE